MGGLPCAKAVIDNGRGAVQTATSQLAAIERALGCMTNSVLLGASAGVFPTEQMEDDFIKSGAIFKDAMADVASKYLADVSKIASYYNDTLNEDSSKASKPANTSRDSKDSGNGKVNK